MRGEAPTMRKGLRAGGAPRLWERVVRESLPTVREAVPAGSSVLEVGYGDGELSCFLAAELGWKIVGLDIVARAQQAAREAAERYGLGENVEFLLCAPEETFGHRGQYDAVFVKTVFYTSETVAQYGAWLDWVLSVLRPGGILVNYETGRANALVQAYRRARGRVYTDLRLYDPEIERLYDARFDIVERRYYGGMSQFLAPVPLLFEGAMAVEAALARRTAANCFTASIVARRRS